MVDIKAETVEELLENAAAEAEQKSKAAIKDTPAYYDAQRREKDEQRRRSNDSGNSGSGYRSRKSGVDVDMKDIKLEIRPGSANGSARSIKDEEDDRRAARAERFGVDPYSGRGRDPYSNRGRDAPSRGDYYRTDSGRDSGRRRSRSPPSDHYRPAHRDRDDYHRDRGYNGYGRDRSRDRGHDYRRNPDTSHFGRSNRDYHNAGGRNDRDAVPEADDVDQDKRTIFVQQLANRLRTKQLEEFFNQVGTVVSAKIVKDRVSGRSKGVGYVTFKDEESVDKAIALTGQKICNIPVIAGHTEAEKNRIAKAAEGAPTQSNGIPFHRLYVGNIHFSVTEDDLTQVFSPFGELEFVQLQKEEMGRSKGYGFVQ